MGMRAIRNIVIFAGLAGLLAVALVGCAGTITTGGEPQAKSLTSTLQSGSEAMPRTISVNGNGKASAPPDVAEIQLGVETIKTDASLAISENTERMTAVMGVLKGLNVEDKDVQTVNYSMWVEEVYDKEGQPTGEMRYHVVNEVRIRLRDLTKTGELLQKALEAGANKVSGISFSVADPVALQREARDQAIADARAKAEQLATGLGAHLGPLHQASEYGGMVVSYEAPMMEKGVGGGAVPVSGGEFSITVEIQVVFDIAD
mgnify:CR=1 FL=1